MPEPAISIIIPARNEAKTLPAAIDSARAAENVQIIVAEAQSRDATIEIARDRGARVVHSPPGRGAQLNAGARAARAPILLFLHADTRLPPPTTTSASRR